MTDLEDMILRAQQDYEEARQLVEVTYRMRTEALRQASKAGMTQAEMAQLLGMTQGTVSALLRGTGTDNRKRP